jgi:SSS family solute:Na+ symporter
LRTTRVVSPHAADFASIVIYFALVFGIGFYLKKYTQSGADFFLAGREMTTRRVAAAFCQQVATPPPTLFRT